MSFEEKRNVLNIGASRDCGRPEITPVMVESVRQRINDAGGILTVWMVLNEDEYETRFGDGFYLHARGLALNSADAHHLVGLAGQSEWVSWHVRSYRLGLENSFPIVTAPWRPEEEFSIGDFVALLCEIAPGGTASKLLTGASSRRDGLLLSLP